MCPELTHDVPRVEETVHTQKDIFILAERRVENAKMAKVKTTHMVPLMSKRDREGTNLRSAVQD